MARDIEADFGLDNIIELNSLNGAAVQIPDGISLFDAEFSREGADLLIVDTDGQILRVDDFFTWATLPDLTAPNGAVLKGDIAARLAGSSLEAQYAQAGGNSANVPIGQVELLEGGGTVTRVDGSVVELTPETKIYQNDLITTDTSGKVSVVFADGTIFTLAEASRMVIDEFVYDPNGSDNAGGFNLITGGFVFIAGQVAKTGDMEVGTPTATMGIRGTTVQVLIALVDGVSKVTLGLAADPDGSFGRVAVFDNLGNFITEITADNATWLISPIEGETRELESFEAGFQPDPALLAEAIAAYTSAFRRVREENEDFVELGDAQQSDAPEDAPPPENNNQLLDPVQDDTDTNGNGPEGPGGDAGGDSGGTGAPPPEEGGAGGNEGEEADVDNVRGDPAPTPEDVVVTGVEDESTTEGISGQVTAESNDTSLTFAIDSTPANGSATVNEDGTFEYTPDADFSGTDTFTYTVTDSDQNTSTGTITVEIAPVNDAPVGQEIGTTLPEDQAFAGTVLATDADGDELTFALSAEPTEQAQNGVAVVLADGTFSYVPDPDFEGVDSFTYVVEDPDGETGVGTVTVTIERSEDVPEVNFELSVLEGSIPPAEPEPASALNEDGTGDAVESASGSILIYDPDTGETFTTSFELQGGGDVFGNFELAPITAGAGFGEYVVAWHYTIDQATYDALPEGFDLTQLFDVEITDSTGTTASVTVTVDVAGINDDPDAADDDATTDEDTSVVLDVLDNDTDVDDGASLTLTEFTQPDNGSVEENAEGDLIYTPDADFNGTDSFTYTITDDQGATDTATATITVEAVNDAPTTAEDEGQTDEDSAILIDVLANDTDTEGETLTLVSASGANNGSVTIMSNQVRYTPDDDFNGTDSFTYVVRDASGEESSATVSVTIDPVNDAPVATDDTASTTEESSVTVDVLSNDDDIDGETPGIDSFGQGSNGSVTLSENTLIYTPNDDFFGTDSFTYTIIDGSGETSSATVNVTVNNINDAPVATANSGTTAEDTSITLDVAGDDVDADGDALTVTAVTQGTQGSVSFSGQSVTYSPNADVNGTDTFTYTVSDGNGGFDTASVTITITDQNDNPTPVNDSASTSEDTPILIQVLSNDSDIDGDTVSIVSVTQSANGTVSVNGSAVSYVPDADFSGTDTFTYAVSDGNGGNGSAQVTVTVNPINDAPVASGDSAEVDEDASVVIDVTDNDTDVDGDALSVNGFTQATNGTVSQVGNELRYTPDPGYNGADSFTYTVRDPSGDTDTATVTIQVIAVNDAPIGESDQAETDEDQGVTIAVLGNDSEEDGDTLTLDSFTQPDNGTVSQVGQQLRYTPDPDFNGTDAFTYVATDGELNTGNVTVVVTVNPVNDLPGAENDQAETDEDSSVQINVLANDSDPDGDGISISDILSVSNGDASLSGNSIVYSPDPNYFGPASIVYEITDGNGSFDTATVTITVNGVNDDPAAANDSATLDEDTSAQINVLANDTDIDGDSLTISNVSTGGNGSATVANGRIVYTPDEDFNGSVTLTYTVSDGNGGSDTATVDVTVNPVNDDPVANNDIATTDEDQGVVINATQNDTDVDGDTLRVDSILSVTNGTAQVAGGNIVYTPTPDFFGTAVIRYVVTDDNGGTDTGRVTVTVDPVNDDPVANNDAVTTNEDTTIFIDAADNDTDIDGGTLVVQSIQGATNGTASVSGGEIRFTPSPNFFDTATVNYTVSDGLGGTDQAVATITVVSVNDDPEADDDSTVTMEDTSVLIDVLDNDSDVEDGTPTLQAITATSGGSATIVEGEVEFIPADNFFGDASFTYRVIDSNGATDTATVDVTVTAVNDRPEAVNDSATVDENDSVTIDVLDNDGDIDNDSLSIVAWDSDGEDGFTNIIQTDNGTDEIVGDQILYTPDADFDGSDSFTYTITDGLLQDTATVTITVNNVNDGPMAVDDTVTVNEDGTVLIDVLDNDSDPDGDELIIVAINGDFGDGGGEDAFGEDGPGGDLVRGGDEFLGEDGPPVTFATDFGVVEIVEGAEIRYTPNANFNGEDSFSYTISDGDIVATATVEVTITPVNDAPTIITPIDVSTNSEDDLFAGIGVPGYFELNDRADDVDDDDDASTLSYSFSNFVNGDFDVITNEGGDVTGLNLNIAGNYDDLSAGESTTATAQVIATDSNGAPSDPSTLRWTVTGVNDGPNAVDDTATITEDTTTTIDVLDNDSDPDTNDTFSITSVTQGSKGSVTINTDSGDGISVDYAPNADATGADTFTYTITDGQGADSTATVFINITNENDAPIAVNGGSATDEETAISGNIFTDAGIGPDSDPDGDTFTVASVRFDTLGEVSIEEVTIDFTEFESGEIVQIEVASGALLELSPDGSFSFDPTGVFDFVPVGGSSADGFFYTIIDENGAVSNEARANSSVSGVNDPPVAGDDTASATEDDVDVFISESDLLDNDEDADSGSSLTITQYNDPANGTLTVTNDSGGGVYYTPDPDFFGQDTFTYQVSDGDGGVDTATVTVTVTPVNDATIAVDDTSTTMEDTSVTIDVLANEIEVDGDSITINFFDTTSAQSGTISEDNGQLVYTPPADFNGEDTFTYTIDNDDGGIDTATVVVTVTPVNDDLTPTPFTINTNEDGPQFTVTFDDLFDNVDTGETVNIGGGSERAGFNFLQEALGATAGFYTPNPNAFGTTYIDFTIDDPNDGFAFQTVTVTVNIAAVNDPPVASDIAFSTSEDTTFNSGYFISDGDGGFISITSVGEPANGTASVDGSGQVSYTPDADYVGSDSFTYTVEDSGGLQDTANFQVTVTPVDDDLRPEADIASTLSGQSVTIDVLDNDVDIEGAAPVLVSVQTTSDEGGSVTIDSGQVVYTAPAEFFGVDTFKYTANDGTSGDVSQNVTVVVNQAPGAFPPDFGAVLTLPTTADEDTPAGAVEIELQPIEVEASGVNLFFALDESGSIGLTAWNTIVDAVTDAVVGTEGSSGLVDQFNGTNVQFDVAIIPFTDSVPTAQNNPATFTLRTSGGSVDTTGFENYMAALGFSSGGTNWTNPLLQAQTYLDDNTPTTGFNEAGDLNVMYFITDGDPFGSTAWQTLGGNNGTLKTNYGLTINALAVDSSATQSNLVLLDTEISSGSVPEISSAQLGTALATSSLFNAQLLDLSVFLVRDGVNLGEIADESDAVQQSGGIEFELPLANIDGLAGLLGDDNQFIITAQFDTDLDGDPSDGILQLSTTASLSKSLTAVTETGGAGNDLLLGSDLNDNLSGDGGDDLLIGFGGTADTLQGDAGDDQISTTALEAADIDGGAGRDILKLLTDQDVTGADLFALNISGIEVIDMTNGEETELFLTPDDIFSFSTTPDGELAAVLTAALSGESELVTLFGDPGDSVELTQDIRTFTQATGADATVTLDGQNVDVYEIRDGGGAILGAIGIDQDISVTIATAPIA